MSAARFWRAVGFDTRGGAGMELGALTLWDSSGRVDALAMLTCSHAPSAGTLAALTDGVADTSCSFSSVRSPGFSFLWDFGTGMAKKLSSVGVGFGADAGTGVERFELHSSSDGANWTQEWSVTGIPFTPSSSLSIALMDYNDAVMASGPVGFWPLDETSGTTAVDLVAGRNGTRTNGVLMTPGLAPRSPACFAPNTLGLISVPSSTAFDLNTLTAELWIKASAVQNLVVFERNANSGFSLQTTTNNGTFIDGSLGVNFGGVATATVASEFVSDGVARHVVVRLSNTASGSVMINGVNKTYVSAPGTPAYNNQPLMIGSRGGAFGLGPGGYIGKVALYDRWLSDAEINLHYRMGRDISLGSPVLRTSTATVSRIAASAPVSTHSTPLAPRLQLSRDVEHGGQGTLYGTTKTKGTPNQPAKARVVLQHQRSKLPVRETWSDPVTGNFAFTGIDTSQQFLTLAEDAAGNFRPVAANRLMPEVQP